jgi:hypothetical protein
MPAAATFALTDGRVAVRCEDDGVLAWLTELLLPGLTSVAADPADPMVAVHTHTRARAGGETCVDLGRLPCFALDREVVHHPAARVGDVVEVWDTKLGARYVLGGGVVDVYPDGSDAFVRVAALRVVRELATAQALAAGTRVQLHAAGFEDGGRIALLAGPKGAGKTTLLMHLASSTGVAMVANDRVLLSPGSGGAWDARPVPTIVSVRPGTMEHLPHLFSAVPAVERPGHLTLAEAEWAVRRLGTVTVPRRLKLSPAQLARAIGVPLSGGGRVAKIALLAFDDGAPDVAVRPLSPEEAAARVIGIRYGAVTTGARTVFERLLGTERHVSADAAVLARLANGVAFVEVRFGPAFLRSDTAVTEVVAELLEGA